MIQKSSTLLLVILITFFTTVLPMQAAASCEMQQVSKPVCKYHVINVYPHDPDAFTQGLIYFDGELYESTARYNGMKSSLRRVKLETGKILQPPPPKKLGNEFIGEGITLWKDRLIQLTLEKNIGFVYDRQTFKLIDDFGYDTDGWGLTHDRSQLIMSDGTDTLHFLDPENFRLRDTVPVTDRNRPLMRLNELEYINDEIFANVYGIDCIARIDPKTGKVIDWLDLTGLRGSVGTDQEWKEVTNNPLAVLNGIAYDDRNKRIFVTGKLWPYLFEIELANS